jgi:hypothetical protein
MSFKASSSHRLPGNAVRHAVHRVNNRQSADFNFPRPHDKKITTDALALIYFGMFAVGVFAGAVLMAGTGNARGKGWPKGEK